MNPKNPFKWRHLSGKEVTSQPLPPLRTVSTSLDVELIIKPFIQGAYGGERLSFGMNGKGFRGNAITANRKSDRPG